LDENGRKLRTRTVRGHWNTVLREIGRIKRPFSICFEAGTGYGYLHQRLSTMARRVAAAHPGHLRLIFRSKRKNDRVDAEKLAKLLFLDEVPPVWVPSVEVRSVGCYFGMIPCQDSSAGKNRLGHITRQGPPTVRKLLVEAARQGIRRSPVIRAYFELRPTAPGEGTDRHRRPEIESEAGPIGRTPIGTWCSASRESDWGRPAFNRLARPATTPNRCLGTPAHDPVSDLTGLLIDVPGLGW